jgi:hypothetical protein
MGDDLEFEVAEFNQTVTVKSGEGGRIIRSVRW